MVDFPAPIGPIKKTLPGVFMPGRYASILGRNQANRTRGRRLAFILDQRRLRFSDMIRGVRKISNSVLLSFTSLPLNNQPNRGRSPRNGTLVMVSFLSCS